MGLGGSREVGEKWKEGKQLLVSIMNEKYIMF